MNKNKKACLPARQGSALLLSTILLFVVLSMVISLSYVTVMEQKMSQKTKSSVGSFFNADSGVEWALNKIATSSEGNIATVFSPQWDATNHYASCPMRGCNVYFLDETGKVITDGNTNKISSIKAVRSVGTQNTGEVTQRAIEAAVAATGGGCYESYKSGCSGDSCCLAGFINKGSTGKWGGCYYNGPPLYFYNRPPAGGCSAGWTPFDSGEAFVCCQS